MRRDNIRLVYKHTQLGDTFTARQLAQKLGLTSIQVAGALKALKGIAIEIAENRVNHFRHCNLWKRTHLQDHKHRYLNEA